MQFSFWGSRARDPPGLSPVSTHILMFPFLRHLMVSGTPSCSLSSMAVAPSSWGRQAQVQAPRPRCREPGLPPSASLSTHLQVLLHLIVHPVQGLRAVLQPQDGLLVLWFPLSVGSLRHLLVGQAQGAQGLLCKGLRQSNYA